MSETLSTVILGKGWEFCTVSGELLILADNSLPDYKESTETPWNYFGDEITSVTIADGNTRVGAHWFQKLKGIKTVRLASTITRICEYAFDNCSNLSTINIPPGVTEIERFAFYLCRKLCNIKFPEGLRKIQTYAFSYCDQLTSPWIPSTLLSIEDSVFHGCLQIKRISLPSGIRKINDGLFDNCEALEEIEIPDTVTEIDSSVFSGCKNLKSVELPESVTKVGLLAFYQCHKLESINLHHNIIELGSSSLEKTSLSSVVLPDKIKKVPRRIFQECALLRSVVIPNGVTVIEDKAFYKCPLLQNLTIPQSVTSIETSAFNGCSSLESISIPNGVSAICERTFKNCTSLTAIDIPPSVTEICSHAFKNCKGLALESIPKSVLKVEENAFEGCAESMQPLNNAKDRAEPVLNGRCGDSVHWSFDSHEEELFIDGEGPIEDYDQTEQQWLHLSNHVKIITVSDSITRIGSYAFRGLRKVTKIHLGVGVSSIGTGAFDNCYLLECIYLSRNEFFVDHFGSLFSGDSKTLLFVPPMIRSLDIPSSTEIISDGALGRCIGFYEIRLSPDNKVFTLSSGCLFSKDMATLIHIPSCSDKVCYIPSNTVHIEVDALKNCGSLKLFDVDEENPNFASIEGVLYTKDLKTLIRCPPRKKWNCIIPEPTESIADGAFLHCRSLKIFDVAQDNPKFTSLDGVLFSKDLKELISYPTKRRDKLRIPRETVSICDDIFESKPMIREVSVGRGNRVFSEIKGSLYSKDLSKLILASSYLSIPAETVSIGRNAFNTYFGVSGIDLSPDNSHFQVSNGSLYTKDMKTLFVVFGFHRKFTIPDEVTTIGNRAFYRSQPSKVIYPYTVINNENMIDDDSMFWYR